MFLFTEMKYQLTRNRGRSLLMTAAALALLGAMAFYLGGLGANQTALNELGEKIPVTVRIVTEDASRSDGLFISTATHDAFVETGLRDVRATTSAAGAFSETARAQEPFAGGDVTMVGLNSLHALPLSRVEYTYAQGVDGSLFEGTEGLCVLEESFAAENSLALGDEFTLPVYLYPYGMDYYSIGDLDLKVAGTFSARQTGGISLLFPVEWLRQEVLAHEKKFFCYDSLSGVVAEPLELNAYKARLKEAGLKEPADHLENEFAGETAILEDEVFTKTANKLRENIGAYQGFLLPFFGLIVLVSALVVFLVLRSSRHELAIASSLGRPKIKSALARLLAVLALDLLGCIIALPIMVGTAGITLPTALLICGLFLACGLVGSMVALALLLRFDTLTLLTKVD